jgi:hypothetical protein
MVSLSKKCVCERLSCTTYVHAFTGYDDYTDYDNEIQTPSTTSEPGFSDNLLLQL